MSVIDDWQKYLAIAGAERKNRGFDFDRAMRECGILARIRFDDIKDVQALQDFLDEQKISVDRYFWEEINTKNESFYLLTLGTDRDASRPRCGFDIRKIRFLDAHDLTDFIEFLDEQNVDRRQYHWKFEPTGEFQTEMITIPTLCLEKKFQGQVHKRKK